MRRALRAIAAGHVTHRAILLAAPANAFRVGRQKGKFTHHVCSQIESIMQPCCQSCFALRQMAAVAAHRRLVTSFEGRFTDLQKCPSCGLLFLSGCFSNGPCSALLAAAGRVSPRRATDFLAARPVCRPRRKSAKKRALHPASPIAPHGGSMVATCGHNKRRRAAELIAR